MYGIGQYWSNTHTRLNINTTHAQLAAIITPQLFSEFFINLTIKHPNPINNTNSKIHTITNVIIFTMLLKKLYEKQLYFYMEIKIFSSNSRADMEVFPSPLLKSEHTSCRQ